MAPERVACDDNDLAGAFRESGSSMFTLGFVPAGGNGSTTLDVLAAAIGLFTVAAQIGYLPTLYAAFNRRETDVALLGARAGAAERGQPGDHRTDRA